jgi:hypothetical protein
MRGVRLAGVSWEQPVFSGGTGRSGTTLIGKLLDRHPAVGRTTPFEVRFLTERFGLCDVVTARSGRGPRAVVARQTSGSLVLFERRLRGRWYRRTRPDGSTVGLFQAIGPDVLEAAIAGFRSDLAGAGGPAQAAARLAHALLVPPVRGRQKSRWIDTTPDNAIRAPDLLRIFPGMRLIHMIRDGRDVAASVATRHWGPNDVEQAMAWWADRMVRAERALAAMPPERVLTVRLEDLVLRDRQATLARILDFLELERAPGVTAYLDREVSADRGHLGRWRDGLSDRERAERERHFEEVVRRYRVPFQRDDEGRLPERT